MHRHFVWRKLCTHGAFWMLGRPVFLRVPHAPAVLACCSYILIVSFLFTSLILWFGCNYMRKDGSPSSSSSKFTQCAIPPYMHASYNSLTYAAHLIYHFRHLCATAAEYLRPAVILVSFVPSQPCSSCCKMVVLHLTFALSCTLSPIQVRGWETNMRHPSPIRWQAQACKFEQGLCCTN